MIYVALAGWLLLGCLAAVFVAALGRAGHDEDEHRVFVADH